MLVSNLLSIYYEFFLKFIASVVIEHDSQKDYLFKEMYNYYNSITECSTEDVKNEIENLDDENYDVDVLITKHIKNRIARTSNECEQEGLCPEFEDYTFKKLTAYGQDLFDRLMKICGDDGYPELRDEWEQGFFSYIRSKSFQFGTGMAFVGYGDAEIYPSLIHVKISGIFDSKLRYYVCKEDSGSISNNNTSWIAPFAQDDVIKTMLDGINPTIRFEVIHNELQSTIDAIKQKMFNSMKEAGVSEKTINKVNVSTEEIDEITRTFYENLRVYIRENFVQGIMDAVDSFNIEDMINMGESLISVTNLHRHISASEESVGGPVDVAVITRSEGFVWAKHKSWFNQK